MGEGILEMQASPHLCPHPQGPYFKNALILMPYPIQNFLLFLWEKNFKSKGKQNTHYGIIKNILRHTKHSL